MELSNGILSFDCDESEAWPASSIRMGRPPNWFRARQIEIRTPAGTRSFSIVAKSELALFFAAIVDRRFLLEFQRSLKAHQGSPAE
ncbi:MAG TPA: hypothetical protein VL068_02070 [Microthrixaceae bacterium]|nr:hypothetical protein [Microthrixaceae bacterium]